MYGDGPGRLQKIQLKNLQHHISRPFRPMSVVEGAKAMVGLAVCMGRDPVDPRKVQSKDLHY